MNYNEAHNYIYNEIGDEGEELLYLLSEDKISEGLTLIKKLTSCDDITAKALWTDIKTDFGSPENNVFLKLNEENKNKPIYHSNTVTCPYCHSTDTRKISGISKAGSVALWGIFALGKTTKQWHCNNCKSDF